MIRPLKNLPVRQRLAHTIPSSCVRSMIPEAGKDYKPGFYTKTARRIQAVFDRRYSQNLGCEPVRTGIRRTLMRTAPILRGAFLQHLG